MSNYLTNSEEIQKQKIQISAVRCKRSLYEFVRQSWHVTFPNENFVDGKHIRLICTALEYAYKGKIRNLIINIPFRHMKSLLVNVFFPAWVWTISPEKKFLFTSYADGLVLRDSLRCRELILSDWYQERFDVSFKRDRNTSYFYATNAGGHRQAITFGGGITGEGGDFVCVDDPLKATDANSDAIRNKVNLDYADAISNRVSPDGCRIIIMQRLHQDDLCGHILSNRALEYEQIVLPAEYDGNRYESDFPELNDWRVQTNEPLWPERFDRKWIDEAKVELTSQGVSSQLQQRPTPLSGGTFKRIWFEPRYSGHGIPVQKTWISCDTAASLDGNPTAILVSDMLVDGRLFIRNLRRGQWEFPKLISVIEDTARENINTLGGILIENKSSGPQAIQTLSQFGEAWIRNAIVAFNPKKGKLERAIDASAYCQHGSVLLPEPSIEYPWVLDFDDEVFNFPNSSTKDIVDSLSQLVWHLRLILADSARKRMGLRSLVNENV